jgi:hypothetical protein
MIDSALETLISLANVPKSPELPRRRRGKRINVSTLYRWATVGCKGIVLETIQVGGTRCTSREALQRFFERLSLPSQAGPVGGGQAAPSVGGRRTIAQRRRQSAESARKLAEMGA